MLTDLHVCVQMQTINRLEVEVQRMRTLIRAIAALQNLIMCLFLAARNCRAASTNRYVADDNRRSAKAKVAVGH